MFPKTGAVKEYNEGFRNTTDNKMEILAVLTGLKMLKEPCIVKKFIPSSAYVVNAVEKGWLQRLESEGLDQRKSRRAQEQGALAGDGPPAGRP